MFGNAIAQMALSISALLPWLCTSLGRSQCEPTASECIQVCLAEVYSHLEMSSVAKRS